MKLFFQIYQHVLCVVAVILLLVICAPSIAGLTPYVVTSGSMEPTVATGALSYINTRDCDDVQINDIIGFKVDDAFVLHRVTDYDHDTKLYTTKGDNNDTEDIGKINDSNIIGTYVFSIPYLGYIVAYIKSSVGIIISTCLVLISIIAGFVYDTKEKQEKI